MRKFNPKVSIVIPVYNGSNYLKEAIESALTQTYKNIEVIVVNDGSNDNGATEKIAMSYGERIRFYKKENGGVATALNFGIQKMTGEYFSWLSHDDMYYPAKVEKQVEFLSGQENKQIFLYSNFSVLEDKKVTPVILDHKMLAKKKKYSLLRGCVNGITVLIPKVIFDDIGSFQTDLKYTQDYDCWMRIQEKYPEVHMENILSITRFHSDQESKSKNAIPECNRLWIRMIEDMGAVEMQEYEGSAYRFYLEMIKFLKSTPYNGALKHCENKLKDIETQINKKQNLDELSSNIHDYFKIRDEENNEKIAHLEADSRTDKNIILELKAENSNLADTLEAVYNSKRYRIIDKIAKAKNRISR